MPDQVRHDGGSLFNRCNIAKSLRKGHSRTASQTFSFPRAEGIYQQEIIFMKLSEFSRIKWERAIDLKKKGEFQTAEMELNDALEEDPNSFLLKASLADLYLRQNKIAQAKILAEAILSSDPQYPQARYIIGEIYLKENNFERALQCFRRASQRDSRPYIILRTAMTLRKMKRYQEALEILDAVLINEKRNIRFMKEKALVLSRLKDWDKALNIYEKLHELDPDDSFVRKEVYRLKGKKRPDEKVIRELKTVVNLPSRKDDPQLHGLLGQKLKEAGNLKEAAAEFRKALKLDPDNIFFLKQEGFCHYHLKNYEMAIQNLSEAFKKTPNDYILKTTLEKLYSTTDNLEGFIFLLEGILKEQPHYVKLMGVLKKIKGRCHE